MDRVLDQGSVSSNGIAESIQSGSSSRKGRTIPGFAREVIVKVAEVCEQEATKNLPLFALNAPTRRAAMYTGVSERTIQRIRAEDRRKKLEGAIDVNGKKYKTADYPEKEMNYKLKRQSRKGQVIPNSARDIICRVVTSCYKEFEEGEYLAPLICKTRRAALYTGVSPRTIQRIKQEDELRNKVDQEKFLTTPGKRRRRSTFRDKIDEFDFHCIRMVIDDLILNKKVYPTCCSLLKAVKESNIGFPYGEDTLFRLLHSKGFNWRPGQKRKKILVEKEDVFLNRTDCIKKIKSHETEGKLIVYLDDKYIGLDADNTRCDTNGIFDSRGGIYCSARLIALTEFSIMEMARRGFRTPRSNSNFSDFTPNISTLEKWLKQNLFPNIPAQSLIVMNTHACDQTDINTPNEYSTKPSLIEFMKRKKLKYDKAQTRTELYDVVKNCLEARPHQPSDIDQIIEQHGHIALRLPMYMSEFSPIELAYVDVKRYLRDKIPTAKTSPNLIKETTLQAIRNLQNCTFQVYVNHVINMENYFLQNEKRMREHFNSMTKNDAHEHNLLKNNERVETLGNKNEAISLTNDNNVTLNDVNDLNASLDAKAPHNDIERTNMFGFMSPPSQIIYGKTVAMPVVGASAVMCENEESDAVQPGPSYLNL